jgi:hypothetical protein
MYAVWRVYIASSSVSSVTSDHRWPVALAGVERGMDAADRVAELALHRRPRGVDPAQRGLEARAIEGLVADDLGEVRARRVQLVLGEPGPVAQRVDLLADGLLLAGRGVERAHHEVGATAVMMAVVMPVPAAPATAVMAASGEESEGGEAEGEAQHEVSLVSLHAVTPLLRRLARPREEV